jgi:hypothetical protein
MPLKRPGELILGHLRAAAYPGLARVLLKCPLRLVDVVPAVAFRRLTKSAYGKHRPVDIELDLWGASGEPTPELDGGELPAAYVLGLGAVGAAFGFALACVPGLKGNLVAVDPQHVSDTDLNRLLTATSSSVGAPKASVFKALFADSEIAVYPFRGRWPQDYLGAPGGDVPSQLHADEAAGRCGWIISCVDRDRADIATRLPLHGK